MSKPGAGRLKLVLRWVVTALVVVCWGAYLWRNWGSLLAYRWQIDIRWLLLSCLAGVAYWVMLNLIWHRSLVSVGGTMSLGRAIPLWTMSMLARYLPGGVWHIAGRVYMGERAGESGAAIFVSTIVEQILGLLSALLVLLASLPFWHADFGRLSPLLILTLPLAVAVHPAVLRRLMSLATRFASHRRGSAILPGIAPHPGNALPTPGYRLLLALLMLYALSNLTAASTVYLAAAALGPVSPTQAPAFAGAYAVGMIVGYFSFFAPSGLGVREGAIALILTPIVGAPVAVAAGALSRVATTMGEAVVVGLCWVAGASGKRRERHSRRAQSGQRP